MVKTLKMVHTENTGTVSIITPTYNSRCYLKEALASVPVADNIEQIVVDGGSIDGTLDFLADRPDIRFIPGPDRGIYDALNKGIAAARGAIIGFLNSDDRYPPGILTEIMAAFEADPKIMVVSGDAIVFTSCGAREHIVTRHTIRARNTLSVDDAMLAVPIMNARFFRRDLFDRLGCFDLSYPLAADREFLIRVALSHERVLNLDRVAYEYRAHPGSRTLAGTNEVATRLARENIEMAERLLPTFTIGSPERESALRWYYDYVVTGLVAAARSLSRREFTQIYARAVDLDRRWRQYIVRSASKKILGRVFP